MDRYSGDAEGSIAAAPLINPSVASQGEMWIMLMQRIPSADAIGQTGLDASSAMGARTFVAPVAFAHAATLSRASGSGSEGWKTRLGNTKPRWSPSTGVNALSPRVEQETFWPEVSDILQWTTTHAFSCLFLCWGAKAALKFFHDIDSHKGERKLFGLFEHRLISDKTGVRQRSRIIVRLRRTRQGIGFQRWWQAPRIHEKSSRQRPVR
jgi:hypothetical protein